MTTKLSRDNSECPEEQNHYDGWLCYDAIEQVLQTCYFDSMSSFDFGNVVKYRWRSDRKGGQQDLEKATVYRSKFVERVTKRQIPQHAEMLIKVFDTKVQEALAMKNDKQRA